MSKISDALNAALVESIRNQSPKERAKAKAKRKQELQANHIFARNTIEEYSEKLRKYEFHMQCYRGMRGLGTAEEKGSMSDQEYIDWCTRNFRIGDFLYPDVIKYYQKYIRAMSK